MIKIQRSIRRSLLGNPASPARLPLVELVFAFAAVVAPHVYATGFYGPFVYLKNGGTEIFGTPEFYWELEVKRLAGQFHPTEKFVGLPPGNLDAAYNEPNVSEGDTEKPWMKVRKALTASADLADFSNALKDGRIKPLNPAKATRQHGDFRSFLLSVREGTEGPLPEEFDSEFADYHKGAVAYLRGKEHWDEARAAWEGLLKRPETERHYRSVWAAFMLGKIALKSGSPDAPKWFQLTRRLAKDGFSDSLGMAADSYGWEGRSEYKQGHPEKAAPLFLTQLAAGDESAIVSLKALIPDRLSVMSMVNYGPEDEELQKMTKQEKQAMETKTMAALEQAAADPLLRRLVTAHILSTATADDYYCGLGAESRERRRERGRRWVKVVKEAGPGKVEDAEYLGWVAYDNGAYKDAARWLEMADRQAPASCWLRAKLQLREGRNSDAAKSLSQALEAVRDTRHYTGWKSESAEEDRGTYAMASESGWSLSERASGDLAQIRLSLNDFIQALDTFMNAKLWEDAAYVAERVLTCDELAAYVDKLPAPSDEEIDPQGWNDADRRALDQSNDTEANRKGYQIGRLRHLLGRKLVRENRMEEAKKYLPSPYPQLLDRYVTARSQAADEKLAKCDQARSLFFAAWIMRYDGMELMGTEVAPDGFVTDGSFPSEEMAKPRLTGEYRTSDVWADPPKSIVGDLPLKATSEEKKRIQANGIVPDERFHYRYLAAEMAMDAAKLLPDNTEELADVINTAGGWVKDRNEKKAGRYYEVLETRCANTEIGRQVMAQRWFAEVPGPWSKEQEAELAAMHSELSLPN